MRRLRLAVLLLALPAVARAQTPGPETVEYYGTDTIGSIRIVWDANGNVLGRQDYAPFGRALFPVPAMPTEGFVGNEQDSETDQGYFHARTFEARTGRFAQVDPIFSGLFAPQAWNRYAYASNRPLNLIDPAGLNAEDPTFWGNSNPACQSFNCDFLLRMQLAWLGLGGSGGGFTGSGYVGGAGIGPGGLGGSSGGSTTTTTTTTTDDQPTTTPQATPNPTPSPSPKPNPVPLPGAEPHPFLTRARTCAASYYGVDSWTGVATDLSRALIFTAAIPLPKSWVASVGIRTTRLGGSKNVTNVLSVLSQGAGTAASGTNVVRIAGRMAGPVAVASALIDTTAIGVCTFIDQ